MTAPKFAYNDSLISKLYPTKYVLLLQYGMHEWDLMTTHGGDCTPSWMNLCVTLDEHVPTEPTLVLKTAERKWELVSAYQKSVRRGDWGMCQRLVSAMCSFPDEMQYWHRRVCVTACEDVGFANQELMNFVIATLHVFFTGCCKEFNYKILSCLTKMMCESAKSRVYCSMHVIEEEAKKNQQLTFPHEEEWAIDTVQTLEGYKPGNSAFEQWCMKNNWRGSGLLKYQVYPIGLRTTTMPEWYENRPAVRPLKGLPNYCYDMYTRVGKRAIARMNTQTSFKGFWSQISMPPEKQLEVIGFCLFYSEGGLIEREVVSHSLRELEFKMVAASFGMEPETFYQLAALVKSWLPSEQQVEKGIMTIDTFRAQALDAAPY